ncbi:MAG: DUF1932 domain-containing protein [Alphaproteobacteria bacterium]
MTNRHDISLIGFGEVGQTLADDLAAGGAVRLAAWDVKFADPSSGPSAAVAARAVRPAGDAADAGRGADIVISAVTAAQAVAAAQASAAAIAAGTFYLDLNSASPAEKRRAARAIEDGGGRYVEAAVMSPIAPQRIATAILLGGPHAAAFYPVAHDLGFAGARVFDAEVGKASAAKMCRSVMIKGIEALLAEGLLAARRYGVDDTVLASLRDLFPLDDWPERARYMIGRSLVHGARRAEEMREVARTVADAGLDPHMSAGAAERQDWAAGFRTAAQAADLTGMLDAILATLDAEEAPEA